MVATDTRARAELRPHKAPARRDRAARRFVAGETIGADGKVDAEVEQAIAQERGGGEPLAGPARAKIEAALTADLGSVRVHTGPRADGLSRALRARAFTVGSDIFFRRGAYDPSSTAGIELIAHEAAHVVQQGSSAGHRPFTVGPSDDESEREASDLGRAVAAGHAAGPRRLSDGGVMRWAAGKAAVRQSTAGKAALGLMARDTAIAPLRHAARIGVLQRSPDFGLALPRAKSEYTSDALMWRRKYPATTLADFSEILLQEVNVQLRNAGVPEMESGTGTGGNVGVFEMTTWTISLDVTHATGKPASAHVSELSPAALAELVQTIYHEARHAEQMFLRARRAVARSHGKDAKTLATELDIKESIVAQAIKAGGALPPAQAAVADRLEKFHSRYVGYRMWINEVRASSDKILSALPTVRPVATDALTQLWKRLDPLLNALSAKPRGAPEPLLRWADRQLDTLKTLTDRDSVDERVLRDLTVLRKRLQTALDAAAKMRAGVENWERFQSTEIVTDDFAERVGQELVLRYFDVALSIMALSREWEDAYERYPEEADTRAVARGVREAVEKRAPPAKRATAAVPP